MITDAILGPILAAVSYVVGLLPNGARVSLPSLDSVWGFVGQVNGLVPVEAPLAVMLATLAAGAVFVVVRLVLTVWNLIWP